MHVQAQGFTPLWPEGKKPNNNGKKITDSIYNERTWKVATPGIYSFIVPKSDNTGTAVLICPGGGYERLSHIYNGFTFAKWFNSIGINVFVLIHRLPHQEDLEQPQIAPLQDAQRAIQIVRQNAKQWNIDPGKVGIMGFSAGGHLASTASTHFDKEVIDNPGHTSLRPDFSILIYPVISFTDSLGHIGSRSNLIGKNSSPEKIKEYSNELQVNANTPPAFLVHARDDKAVKYENSVQYYDALIKNKVPAELRLYDKGGHGFGMNNQTTPDKWMDQLKAWLEKNHFINQGH